MAAENAREPARDCLSGAEVLSQPNDSPRFGSPSSSTTGR